MRKPDPRLSASSMASPPSPSLGLRSSKYCCSGEPSGAFGNGTPAPLCSRCDELMLTTAGDRRLASAATDCGPPGPAASAGTVSPQTSANTPAIWRNGMGLLSAGREFELTPYHPQEHQPHRGRAQGDAPDPAHRHGVEHRQPFLHLLRERRIDDPLDEHRKTERGEEVGHFAVAGAGSAAAGALAAGAAGAALSL